ncbi:MAG: hypothetical protein ACRELD_03280 [Longimicrobiales bacterium]
MRVAAIGLERASGGRVRLSAEVIGDDGATRPCWFEVPADAADHLGRSGNPWAVALLPLAALRGEPLRIAAPVDGVLLDGLPRVLEIWRAWYPHLQAVLLEAERADDPVDPVVRPAAGLPPRRVGAFFSGGVDSFFTALRRRSGPPREAGLIDELISVHGFDIPLGRPEAFERLAARHARVATSLGVTFVAMATNVREELLAEVPWGPLAHGCALAATALALGSRYRTVLIPATGGYRDLHPWGSHPLTDPLLSTASTAFVHDGAAFSRVDKTRLLVAHPAAMSALRVCWESWSDENCGACGKCLRTVAILELLGGLSRCATFPAASLDVGALARLQCAHSWDYRELRDIRALALVSGRPDVARAAAAAMRRSRLRGTVRRMGGLLREHFAPAVRT